MYHPKFYSGSQRVKDFLRFNSFSFGLACKQAMKLSFLVAELLVDKAMELDHVGGTFGGNIKPTPFLCLVLKMLQIQPEKEIVVEFIKNEDYK